MGPFVVDLVLGIFFIVFTSISVLGFLAFRYRRDLGPLLLMISGILGIAGSSLSVISRSGALEISDLLPLFFFGFSILFLIISIILRRSRS